MVVARPIQQLPRVSTKNSGIYYIYSFSLSNFVRLGKSADLCAFCISILRVKDFIVAMQSCYKGTHAIYYWPCWRNREARESESPSFGNQKYHVRQYRQGIQFVFKVIYSSVSLGSRVLCISCGTSINPVLCIGH